MGGPRERSSVRYDDLQRGVVVTRRKGSVKVSIAADGRAFKVVAYDEDAATFLWRVTEPRFDRAVVVFRQKSLEAE